MGLEYESLVISAIGVNSAQLKIVSLVPNGEPYRIRVYLRPSVPHYLYSVYQTQRALTSKAKTQAKRKGTTTNT
jgi:hypothetical protein